MKKFILAAIMALSLSTATGCNKQVVDLNLKFNKALVKVGDEWVDVDVKKWTDYEDGEQIQLTLHDGTVMIVHSANLILYKGTLPTK